MSNADKYRDIGRYKNTINSQSNLSLGSNSYKRHDVSFGNNLNNIKDDNALYKTAQYSRSSEGKYTHKHIAKNKRAKKRKNIIRIIITFFILCVVGIGVYKFWPIKVNINDQELTLTYDKTLNEAIAQSGIKVYPGNFVAVDYSVLNKSEGYEFYAEVNGKETSNLTQKLHDGDDIKYENGKDRMEDYNSDDSDIVAKSSIKGTGSIHKFNGKGTPGTWSKLHGKVSGIYTERQTKDSDDVTVKQYNVNPDKDKVIALTFDDGPSEDFTQEILDLLKKYDAHATFFVIGENIEENWGKKLIRKEDEAGHQVCTHSYDHARSAGGTDMTIMTKEKQIKEITEGLDLIREGLGHDPSTVVRLPGGNMNEVTARLIAPFVTAEIGWNIDTGDWEKPGKDKILSNMKLAASGDVVLCHDGGGDRSQTVEALEQFLKAYTEKGYKFITIDELMEYPEAKQKNDAAFSTSTYAN